MQQEELFQFLHVDNPQARKIALENLLPHTPNHAPNRSIFFEGLQSQKESTVIGDLKLLCRDNLAISHDAFRALVNLSDSPIIHPYLIEQSFFTFLVSYIVNPQATLADLAAMLLSNLTTSPRSCTALLALHIPIVRTPSSPAGPFYPTQSRAGSCASPVPYPTGDEINVRALPLLIDAFAQGANIDPSVPLDKRSRKSELHFLASVFANLSTSHPGRMFFLTPQPSDPLQPELEVEYPLTKLVVFTEHNDTIRRGGVSSLIKNCSFYAQGHRAILSPDSETVLVPPSNLSAPGIDALQHILLPLAGPEELDLDAQEQLPVALQFLPPTKKRESDPVLRLTHVESLLLLCTTRWGRDHLRTHGVYEVVRTLHEQETNDAVSEHIERLVNLLKRAEESETAHDLQVEEVEDDADFRIEEI